MIATLASWRSRVQIPLRPPETSRAYLETQGRVLPPVSSCRCLVFNDSRFLSLSLRLRQFLLVVLRHDELFACCFIVSSIFQKMRVASAVQNAPCFFRAQKKSGACKENWQLDMTFLRKGLKAWSQASLVAEGMGEGLHESFDCLNKSSPYRRSHLCLHSFYDLGLC
jgi:hypothetical protein